VLDVTPERWTNDLRRPTGIHVFVRGPEARRQAAPSESDGTHGAIERRANAARRRIGCMSGLHDDHPAKVTGAMDFDLA
jgi:hypothetical protein